MPIEARETIKLNKAIRFDALLLIALIKIRLLKINAGIPEKIAHVPISGTKANARFSIQNIRIILPNNFHLRFMFSVIFYSRKKL